MDPINSINQLMAVLKRQLAERGERTARNGNTQNSAPTRQTQPRTPSKASPEEIQRRIGLRLRNLKPDERLGSRGTQVFIESVLAWEFGEEVLNDPRLGDLVVHVRETLAEDPALQQSMQTLLQQLTARAG